MKKYNMDYELQHNALNNIAAYVYTVAKDIGFHTTEVKFGDYISNIHSEVSELWEARRSDSLNSPCNKADKMKELGLKPLTCIEEELADIIIRTLDMCHTLDVDIDLAVKTKSEYNKTRPYRNGKLV
jgi:NTP pyrophosphatase (non-canonical NTP hydrolase)